MQICEVGTLKDLVVESGKLFGPRVFLEHHLGSKTISFSYLKASELVEKIGKGLCSIGIGKGDRVGLVAPNSPEWIVSFFATAFIGAIVVPIDPTLPPEEIANVLIFAKAKAVFCDLRRSSFLEKIFSERGWRSILIKIDQPLENFSMDDIRNRGAATNGLLLPDVKKEDVAAYFLTSGTNGTPRVVALSHYNFLSNALGARTNIPTYSDDNALCILPLTHTYSFTAGLLMFFVVGAKITILNSYKPYRIFETIEKTGVSIIPAVPLFLQLFHDNIIDKLEEAGLPKRILFKMLFIVSALTSFIGIPLGKILFRGIRKKFGP